MTLYESQKPIQRELHICEILAQAYVSWIGQMWGVCHQFMYIVKSNVGLDAYWGEAGTTGGMGVVIYGQLHRSGFEFPP